MANKDLISVICLGYNHAPFINDCIQSIWNQDYKNIEIIAIDDGSKDNSVEILKELQSKSPFRMEIIAQKNTGIIGLNFNRGATLAKGKWLSFISMDDILVKTCFSEKKDFFENNYLIFNSKVNYFNSTQSITTEEFVSDIYKVTNPTAYSLLELEYSNLHSFFLQGSLFSSEVFKCVNGFDEDMIADDIVLRTKFENYLVKIGADNKIAMLDTVAVIYRKHENNISSNSIRQLKSAVQYCRRYWTNKDYPMKLKVWFFCVMKNVFFDSEKRKEVKKLVKENNVHYFSLSVLVYCIKNRKKAF